MTNQSKRISQETFDETVKENMDDFDMSREDAIADAIEQFKMQGIDLSNIVTSLSCSDTSQNPILAATKRVQESASTDGGNDAGQAASGMHELRELLSAPDADAEAKVMAGNAGALEAALGALERFAGEREAALSAYRLLTVLIAKCETNRQRLCEPKGAPRVGIACRALPALPDDAEVQEVGMRFFKLASTKCEAIKAEFMRHRGVENIRSALEKHGQSAAIAAEVGGLVHSLTNADDYSTLMSGVFDAAKAIGHDKAQVLPLVYAAMREHAGNPTVLKELVAALKGCAIQKDVVEQIIKDGGMNLVLAAFREHVSHNVVAARCMMLIANMAENDDLKKDLCSGEAYDLMLNAMGMHANDPLVVKCGFAAMASMALRMPENTAIMMEKGAGTLLLEGMRAHPSAAEVNRQAMIAIRNMVCRCPEIAPVLLADDLEELIKTARDSHIKCAEAAFDCLRDLGCEYGGLGDQAGKGANSAYVSASDSLQKCKAGQLKAGSAMVTWEEED
jgi:hypothetical protein